MVEAAYIVCADESCESKIKDTKWDKIKAVGWFFTKSGEAWCPDHRPDWYERWRRKNDQGISRGVGLDGGGADGEPTTF